jgi:hypothetical protein
LTLRTPKYPFLRKIPKADTKGPLQGPQDENLKFRSDKSLENVFLVPAKKIL